MAKKYAMLVMANAGNNNNKFYEMKLEDNDEVIIRYGRVGNSGVTESKGFGEDTFDKVANAKRKKGYRDVDVMVNSSTGTTSSADTGNIVEIAKRDIIKGDPVLGKLIEKLAKINRHQLVGASGGNIDIVDGQVKTALGVLVTLDSVEKAKNKLVELNTLVTKHDLGNAYVNVLEDYLTLVPQKIQSKRGWDQNFFTEFTTFQNQSALLEQIELSIKNYTPPVVDQDKKIEERLFGYSLELLQNDKEFNDINKFYCNGINSRHVTKNYKLHKVYVLKNDDKLAKYEVISSKLGNNKRLWHGTRACNVLSIMKGGLIIPPLTGGNYTIAGRMFGNSVYFSDESTKSLNYATPYWTGGAKELNELFMFAANVSMGREYTPRGPTHTIPSGYDSIFAKGGYSGVMNNEMVVPNVDQFHLQYLCEFSE